MEASTSTNIGLAAAASAAALKKTVTLREKKITRIQKEREADAQKALQNSRLSKESGHDKARRMRTMQTYFLASHNSDNGNAIVGPQLFVQLVNQAVPLNLNSIASV